MPLGTEGWGFRGARLSGFKTDLKTSSKCATMIVCIATRPFFPPPPCEAIASHTRIYHTVLRACVRVCVRVCVCTWRVRRWEAESVRDPIYRLILRISRCLTPHETWWDTSLIECNKQLVCVSVCVSLSVCLSIYMCLHATVCDWVCAHTCLCIYACVCLCVCVYACVCVSMSVYACVYVCVCACMWMHVHVDAYQFAYIRLHI